MRLRRFAICCAALLALVGQGCGKQRETGSSQLTFEREDDTTGLSRGAPLLRRIEPYRAANGALRVRGEVEFPDGVRIQISLYPKGGKQLLNRIQVVVDRHRLDSPPMLGPTGPLPHGDYRFEYLSLFNDAWQTPEIMRRIDGGRALRGPGITRDKVGGAAFYLVEERTL